MTDSQIVRLCAVGDILFAYLALRLALRVSRPNHPAPKALRYITFTLSVFAATAGIVSWYFFT